MEDMNRRSALAIGRTMTTATTPLAVLAVAAAFALWIALISIGSPAPAQQNGIAAGEAEAAVKE